MDWFTCTNEWGYAEINTIIRIWKITLRIRRIREKIITINGRREIKINWARRIIT